MADDPKADLKARLGLKRGGAQAPQGPIVPGAPPPEPDKPKGPTQATIEEAKRHAAEAEKAAGPAIEQFSFGAPEKTPLPGLLPSRRVEYVEVRGSEELPEAAKKRRLVLIMAVVGAALVAFLIGRMAGGSSARADLNDSAWNEAWEKVELLLMKMPTFVSIDTLAVQLSEVDKKVKGLDPETGDITTLETDFADLLGSMAKFSNNKQSSLDPAEVMGTYIVNGDVMRVLVTLAYQTRFFHESVNSAVEEAQAMFRANPMPPPEQQKLFAVAEPDTLDVEGLGKVPLTKGTIVAQAGKAEPVQMRDPAGNPVTEFYQRVRVEGRAEPLTIKSIQMVQIDMAPFFAKSNKSIKRLILARLAVIIDRLVNQWKKLDARQAMKVLSNVILTDPEKARERVENMDPKVKAVWNMLQDPELKAELQKSE